MTTTNGAQELANLQQEVNSFVDERFADFVPTVQDSVGRLGGKVIRDPIHGFLHLRAWEVEILDSPLVQRLRYIHQNALAYLVYPSANHSRLEHSLGMAKVVQDVARAFTESSDARGDLFDRTTVDELRLAALLHDTGHGIFSHLSESLIKSRWNSQFTAIGKSEPYIGKEVGEILSHLLVTSNRFKQFLGEVKDRHHLDYDVDRIAGYIVGRTDTLDEAYKADLITGPIDADKLDYLPRDSYFTGIRTEVDTQHIIQSMEVWDGSGGIPKTLVVGLSGATSVEQMHFAKLSLFPAMYNHQKVRALECMIRGIVEKIWEAGDDIGEPALRLQNVTDFLRFSDFEFLTLAAREPQLRRKTQRLINRNLLRRALHISALVLRSAPAEGNYSDFVKLGAGGPEDQIRIRALREEIFEQIPQAARIDGTTGEPLDVSDLWVDIPKAPSMSKDIMRCYVNSGGSAPIPLRTLFPIDAWLDAYAANKWTAHVFGFPDENHLKLVNNAAINVLENRFNLQFSPQATEECKL